MSENAYGTHKHETQDQIQSDANIAFKRYEKSYRQTNQRELDL
jgi:hypothetical protein